MLSGPFEALLANRVLVARLVSRDIRSRFQGSMLGACWALAVPLISFAAYWFVLGVVLQVKWGGRQDASFALMLFSGLVVYWFAADVLARAPSLILEHRGYIGKVVFPLATLPWVSVATAAFQLCANLLILLVAQWWIVGAVPPAWPLVLLVLLPLVPLLLGLSWLLAALGVYLRDLQQLIPLSLTLGMFLSPIFFSTATVPDAFRQAMFLNPLTLIIEQFRAVAIEGQMPDLRALSLHACIALFVMYAGHACHARLQRGFADAV